MSCRRALKRGEIKANPSSIHQALEVSSIVRNTIMLRQAYVHSEFNFHFRLHHRHDPQLCFLIYFFLITRRLYFLLQCQMSSLVSIIKANYHRSKSFEREIKT